MIVDVDPIRERYEIAFDTEHREHEPGRILHCWRIDEMWKTERGYYVKYGAGEYFGSIDIDDDMQKITLRDDDMCYEEMMPELLYIDTIIKLKRIYEYVNIEEPKGIQIDYSCGTRGFKISFKNCLCTKHLPDGREYVVGFRDLHFSDIKSFTQFCTNWYLLKAGNGDQISVALRCKHREIIIRVVRSKYELNVTYCPSERQFDALADRLEEIYRAFKEHMVGPNMDTDDSDEKKNTVRIEFDKGSRLYELHYGETDRCVVIKEIRFTKTGGYRLNRKYGKCGHFTDIDFDENEKKIIVCDDEDSYHEERLSESAYEKITDDLAEVFVHMNVVKHLKDTPWNYETDSPKTPTGDLKGGNKDKRDMAPRQEESPKAPKGYENVFDFVSKDVRADMARNVAHNEGDTGKKYDSGKRRYDLVDLDVIGAIADVLGFGAQKYGENTWQNLPEGEKRYFAALMRHLEAHQRGETVDPESGYPHIYHALTNVYFLTYFYNHREDRRQ